MINDTIVAIATAPINQALAIIRVSGTDAWPIIKSLTNQQWPIFKRYPAVMVTELLDQNQTLLDQVVLIVYQAPASFTGEDVVEISCHGGVLVTQAIYEAILTAGARPALPGEFSQRAFLNHKIDLLQAEAINDLISADNDLARKLAIKTVVGQEKPILSQITASLLDIITTIKVNIDYPEYDDIQVMTTTKLLPMLKELSAQTQKIIQAGRTGQIINEGLNTVIVGRPNVGKSSLLNALLKQEKAIVSTIKGTTRDLVEGKLNLGFVTLKLIDTAGIHNPKTTLEAKGIAKTKAALKTADLVIAVFDASKPLQPADRELLAILNDKITLKAINKSDLKVKLKGIKDGVYISAYQQQIDPLITAIKNKFKLGQINYQNNLVLTNTRQLAQMNQLLHHLKAAIEALNSKLPLDMALIDLESGWNCLQGLTGQDQPLNLLDEIFRRFCVGK